MTPRQQREATKVDGYLVFENGAYGYMVRDMVTPCESYDDARKALHQLLVDFEIAQWIDTTREGK